MYTVDGLGPEGAGWLLFITGSGIRGTSGRVGGLLELPGMDGGIPQMGAPFMPGTLTLRYRILVSTHEEFMAIIEKFNGVFGQRRKLLPITHAYSGSVSRMNYGTVLETIVPEPVSNDYAYYQVTLTLPEPFWRSPLTYTIPTPALTETLTAQILTNLDGTGPINDALIRVKGAFSTAVVEDYVTGDRITVNTPLTATQYVVIDCANWTARRVTTDTWTGGTDISALVSSNKGRGPMLTLEPDNVINAGRYRLRVQATNPASSPVAEVRARKSYH
ncbi:phage tail family protein [Glutamicibacter ardleyensis]|uniref:Minor tail protein n=1 Tax=Glutamicibacter ardleyensis TaxID=225894 RepID=A0ABQ2DFF5_9MICC|nr:hypothetical protein [Glutamicibacter ardleyensis]GGJ55669.1 hypothetical protein GCM10007173_13060 [Glutamicibacter ardleyensis]